MKGFIGLTKRDLLLFFKDKQSVAFSLLTSIIVLVLYLLFLKGSYVDSVNSVFESYEGLSDLISEDEINTFVNMVLLTGILGSAMITVPYNCLMNLVRDKENKIDYDILATPIKRWRIILSYFVSAALSSIILTSIILTAGLLATGIQGKLCLSVSDIFAAYGVVALGSVSATALFMILVLSFKSSGASSAFFGILSAASGFVIGAYIPISQFSGGVQTVCNIFPASQVTIILRNILMNGVLSKMNDSIGGIDDGMTVETIKEIFTFKAHVFGNDFGMNTMVIYVLAGIAVCIAAQVALYSATYKRKS